MSTTEIGPYSIRGFGDEFVVSLPLTSHIVGNLWIGGCPVSGVQLADDFKFVVSLYTDEKFSLGPNTVRIEAPLADDEDCEMPEDSVLYNIARGVNAFRKKGKTLVHCQVGLNRSALICALALIIDGMQPTDAIALLREKRSEKVLCNRTFERWLKAQDVLR